MADNDISREATPHDSPPLFDKVAEEGAVDGLGLPPFLSALLRQANAEAAGRELTARESTAEEFTGRALPQRPFYDWPDDEPEGHK